MTARQLEVLTVILPDPIDAQRNSNLGAIQANATDSYQLERDFYIQTLSADLKGIEPNAVQGLLYVPSLSSTDPCNAASDLYVPKNVTRLSNIPTSSYTAVALVPWFSITCTQSYLNAANDDADVVHAVIFYQVNDTSTGTPPPVSNPIWSLNDGGHWKSTIQFPAYAVPGGLGRTLMQESSFYSGNVTTAPNGDSLTSIYGPGGEARLFAELIVNAGPSLPSLWVFLIVVLAVLLIVIAGSSLGMGYLQRRRRRDLRRRVENGEVDLETLGIKRINVPQSELDKMPLYTYTNDEALNGEAPTVAALDAIPEIKEAVAPAAETLGNPEMSKAISTSEGPKDNSEILEIVSHAPTRQHFSQTTCAICLDDFVSETTTIRELPCHHIFHPECVDVFLREHSSACPMCKKSTLPKGFCPPIITNAMVRREQLLRRIRARRAAGDNWRMPVMIPSVPRSSSSGQVPVSQSLSLIAFLRERLNPLRAGAHRGPDVSQNADVEATAAVRPIELSGVPNPPQPPDPSARLTASRRASVVAIRTELDPRRRREIARQRAVAHLTRQDAETERDIQREQRRAPVWRRAVGRVFPALS